MLCPSSEQAPRRKGLCLDTLYPSGLRQFLAHSKRSTGRIDTWILLSEYVQRCLDWCLSNVNDYFGTGEFGVNFSCLYFFFNFSLLVKSFKMVISHFHIKKSLIKKIIPTDMCSVGECYWHWAENQQTWVHFLTGHLLSRVAWLLQGQFLHF